MVLTMFGVAGLVSILLMNQLQTATPSCVLPLPDTITTHAVDTSSACCSCQALQAEREGQTHQYPGHSG